MAQKVSIELVDDLTGEVAQETVQFGLDGTNYEIDLSTDNATRLRDALGTYVENGRKDKGKGSTRQRRTTAEGTSGGDRDEVQRIRQWAQENGRNVNSRGRISSEIRDAYRAATS